MTQLQCGFEQGKHGANVTTSDGTNTAGAPYWDVVQPGSGTITYDGTRSAYGAMSAKFAAASSSNCYVAWTTALGTVTRNYGRLYLYMTSYPASSTRLLNCLSGGTSGFAIGVNSSGKLQGIDTTGTAYTFSTVITLNAWVRVDFYVVHSATVGQHELKLYNRDDQGPSETQTSAANRNTQASCDQIRIGVGESGHSALTFWLDNVLVGAPGPKSPNTVGVSAGRVSTGTHAAML
jgi:hypothetical protein